MKTHVAVYEENLFDLGEGGKLFKGGKCPLSPLPQKETLMWKLVIQSPKGMGKISEFGDGYVCYSTNIVIF